MWVEDILGPNLGSLKGKTTRKYAERVVLDTLDNLPKGLLDEHGDVTIAVNIMYINEIPFMLKTTQTIHFSTEEMIINERKSMIIKMLQ